MLKRFEVSGFKNFKNRTILDFSDVREYKFNKHCISNGSVSKMIIYGRNSIGKSNLGLALFDIVSHLSSKNVTPGVYDYYLNVDSELKYAEFRYLFDFNDIEVDYIYKKNEDQAIVYEKLLVDNKLIFQRNEDRSVIVDLYELAPTLNLEMLDVESLLKYIVTNTVLDDNNPIKLMFQYVNNMLWFRSLDENRFIGYRTKSEGYFDFIFDDTILKEFEEFLCKSGVDAKLVVKTDNDGKKRLYFDNEKPLPFFKVASSGTKALYTFFYWYKTAENVSLLFIDEFDAFYHYELAESIVDLLEKMSNTQIILTTHNTNLLTNRIMRPDCYFILTKGRLTSFANATDRELREGHNLEKLFMSGEFDG